MTLDEVLDRAKSAIGRKCVYELGRGGFDEHAPWPWDYERKCDCSGCVAWDIGQSRHTTHPWYQDFNGGWLSTEAIMRDCGVPYGMFNPVPWEQAKPGHLIVYGNQKGHHGHVGIVSALDEFGPVKAVHCSLGNWREDGDAIMETGVGVFLSHGAIIARCCLVQEPVEVLGVEAPHA